MGNRKKPVRTKRFAGIPHIVMEHPDYISLSAYSVKLLLEVAKQFCGNNNGKLCITWSQMQARGFKSKDTLNKAKKELLKKQFLVISKAGGFDRSGRHTPHFYALTWQPIDEIYGFQMELEATSFPIRNFAQRAA